MVAPSKRERQKAGRQARLAAQEAARKRTKRRRQAMAGGVLAVAVIGAVIGVTLSTRASLDRCPNPNGSSPRATSFPSLPPNCINSSKTYAAKVVTDVGSYTITLGTAQAPKTVNDFVFLARYHYYDGLKFHRVIPGFVVQGGDPAGTGSGPGPYPPNGTGFVQGEVPKAGSYKIGSVAMAKTGSQPAGAAANQYFVVTGPQGVRLPPDYSLFGQVTSGMEVVKEISAGGTAMGTPTVTHKMLSIEITES